VTQLSKQRFRQQRLEEIEREVRQLDSAFAGREMPWTASGRLESLEAEHRDLAAEIAELADGE